MVMTTMMMMRMRRGLLSQSHTHGFCRYGSRGRRWLTTGQGWTPSQLMPSTAQPPYNILFMGTDDVSLETLKFLHHDMMSGDPPVVRGIDVITPGDRRVGRTRNTSLPVKKFATDHSLTVFEIPPSVKSLSKWDSDFFTETSGMYDFGVAVSFGYFVNKRILRKLQWGAINMHPSLLPEYRGAAPIHHVLLDDLRETGVSVIEIHPEQFDSGRVISQRRVSIHDSDTYSTLRKRLAEAGASTMLQCIRNLSHSVQNACDQNELLPPGKSIEECPTAPKISKEMRSVDIAQVSSRDFYNLARALSVSPGFSFVLHPHDVQVKLLTVAPPMEDQDRPLEVDGHKCMPEFPKKIGEMKYGVPSGTLYYDRPTKSLWVKTRDSWIEILQAQAQQRQAKTAKAFASDMQLTQCADRMKLKKLEN